MQDDCPYCGDGVDVLLTVPLAQIRLPTRCHISPNDGGHLLAVPGRHVPNRVTLSRAELLAIDYCTILAARALQKVFGSSWFNFQENGNWATSPMRAHIHQHIYGRHPDAIDQRYGEALRFPLRAELDHWHVPGPDPSQVAGLRSHLRELRRLSWASDFEAAIEAAHDESPPS